MKRLVELDGLRGLAAIGVVGFHYAYGTPAFDSFWYIGSGSLELFFVLSGFLISSIILAHANDPGFLKAFYIRRSLRIWPVYYLTILAYALLILRRPDLGDLRVLPQYLTFTQNLPFYWFKEPIRLAYALRPTWSLAIEEQFYLIWPLLICFLGRCRMVPLAILFVVVGITARLIGFHETILISRCDGFAMGALLAYLLDARNDSDVDSRRFDRQLRMIALGAAVYLAVSPYLRGKHPFEITEDRFGSFDRAVFALFFAACIGLTVIHQGSRWLAPLRNRALVYIGTISYGIYLYHLTALIIAEAIGKRLGMSENFVTSLFGPTLTLLISAASWTFIEKPCLKFKHYFAYQKPQIHALDPTPHPETNPA